MVTPRQPLGDNSSAITEPLSFLLSPKARLITSCRACLYSRFHSNFFKAPRLIRFRAQDNEQINERIEYYSRAAGIPEKSYKTEIFDKKFKKIFFYFFAKKHEFFHSNNKIQALFHKIIITVIYSHNFKKRSHVKTRKKVGIIYNRE